MNTLRWCMVLVSCCSLRFGLTAQELYLEGGAGFGNIPGESHRQGKGELFIGVYKPFGFGTLGFDLAGGGNLIPTSNEIDELDRDIIAANDTRFTTVSLLYRRSLFKHLFIEPRMGFSTLSAYVHADEQSRISSSNVTAGLGIGGRVEYFTLSLRYQYLGKTADFRGIRDDRLVIAPSEHISVILIRVGYRFDLSHLFEQKKG